LFWKVSDSGSFFDRSLREGIPAVRVAGAGVVVERAAIVGADVARVVVVVGDVVGDHPAGVHAVKEETIEPIDGGGVTRNSAVQVVSEGEAIDPIIGGGVTRD